MVQKLESTMGKRLKNGSTTKQSEKVNRVSSGAQVYESCRSRQELSNEYLLAKIGCDTAENEPFNFHTFSSLQGFNPHLAERASFEKKEKSPSDRLLLEECWIPIQIVLPLQNIDIHECSNGSERTASKTPR